MKRSFEGKGGGEGPPRKGRKGEGGKGEGGGRGDLLPCILKFLAPEVLASAVIGKGGAVIKEIRESTQAKIAFSEHHELYPGTDCRVMTASANTTDALNELCKQLIGKISECAEASGAPSETLGTPEELKLRTIMPRVAVGGIIGKGGSVIKRLRETSGAKVSVADATSEGPGQEQIVTITGTLQALEYVMQEANTQIQNVGQEPWFKAWGSFSEAANGGGWAPSKGDYKGGKGDGDYKGGKGDYKGGKGDYKGDYGREDYGYSGRDSWGGKGGNSGVDTMMRVSREMPPYVMDDSRGFAMSCVVPSRLVGGLIGRQGAHTKEVQQQTGTKIGIREIDGDPDNRTLNIAGPLAATCAAYMLMMKRYLDVEAETAAAPVRDEYDGKGRDSKGKGDGKRDKGEGGKRGKDKRK